MTISELKAVIRQGFAEGKQIDEIGLSLTWLKELAESHDRLLMAAMELVKCHELRAGILMTEAFPAMKAAIKEAK